MPPHTLIKTPYDELTYKIIGCAMAIHRALGPRLREDTYQRDLELRLTDCGLAFVPQKLLEVYDSDHPGALLGYYIPDFIVADTIVVEIKALRGLDGSHVAQVIGYSAVLCHLAVTGCPLGLLINFGECSLKFRRILPPRDIAEHRLNREWLWVPDSMPR